MFWRERVGFLLCSQKCALLPRASEVLCFHTSCMLYYFLSTAEFSARACTLRCLAETKYEEIYVMHKDAEKDDFFPFGRPCSRPWGFPLSLSLSMGGRVGVCVAFEPRLGQLSTNVDIDAKQRAGGSWRPL